MSSLNPAPLSVDLAASDCAGGLPGLRAWFVAFTGWMVGLATAAQLFFGRYEHGQAAALGPWVLALLCFYLSLCNSLVPLPTAWIVLLAASDDVMICGSPWLRVTAVALAGALATTVANLNEYHVLGFFLRARLGERLRRTRTYTWAIRWFDAAPLQTLTLVAFVPLPVDVVRWLAILRRYRRLRFAGAYFVGRLARYALLAGASVALTLTAWQIVFIQGAIIAVLALRLVWHWRQARPSASATPA